MNKSKLPAKHTKAAEHVHAVPQDDDAPLYIELSQKFSVSEKQAKAAAIWVMQHLEPTPDKLTFQEACTAAGYKTGGSNNYYEGRLFASANMRHLRAWLIDNMLEIVSTEAIGIKLMLARGIDNITGKPVSAGVRSDNAQWLASLRFSTLKQREPAAGEGEVPLNKLNAGDLENMVLTLQSQLEGLQAQKEGETTTS